LLKKTITYEDFNGTQRTEDFYFHLSRADLVEMQLSKQGGLDKWLQNIIDSEDGAMIMSEFKKLILDSYGQKSDDGKRFIKTQELRDEFLASEAYSVLFMELCTQQDKAAEFVNGLLPKGMDQELSKIGGEGPKVVRPADPGTPGVPRVLSPKEAREMDQSELSHLLATGAAVLGNSSEG
jgi:hypothetical protein